MAAKDLTGQRFGKLTVLRLADPVRSPGGKQIRRWHCLCDCGNEIDINQNALTSKGNPTTSCGCSRLGKLMTHKIGERFGKLEIIGYAPLEKPIDNGQKTGYLCLCDCGRKVVLPTKALLANHSCGCDIAEKAAERIMPDGQNVFGRENGSMRSKTRPGMPPTIGSHTGVRGVYWSSREQCYIAKIGYRNKSITIGRFKSLNDAKLAREEAEREIWPSADDDTQK